MNGIQIFQNNQFGQIRVATNENGEPMFAATDIARTLGYSNPQKAIRDHCKGVNESFTPTESGIQSMKFIPEADVFRLIMKSRLPQAEQFQDWVCGDVLPSIRKHGGYLTPEKVEEALLNPDTLIQLATQLKNERAKRIEAEAHSKELEPKALFADAVATSDRSILIAELAKILRQNGVEIGQNRLFEWLRHNGYLCSKGEYYNQPTQRSMDMGLFEIKKTSITKPNGSVLVTCTTKVSGRGQVYFVNKFLSRCTA
jgi:anti-repressor protein